jgi:hypothetical protein
MTTALIEFLRERLHDDEYVALDCFGVNDRADMHTGTEPPRWRYHEGSITSDDQHGTLRAKTWEREGDHISRHDPARILREVEAGRRLLRMYEGAIKEHEHAQQYREPHERPQVSAFRRALEAAVKFRALSYTDHPEYRDEWRP